AADDVVGDVVDAQIAELAVAQPRHGVVLVEALLRLGGRLDMPLDEWHLQRGGDLEGQHGLAGAGLALDEQRALQGDGSVDSDLEIARGDIARGAAESLAQGHISCGFPDASSPKAAVRSIEAPNPRMAAALALPLVHPRPGSKHPAGATKRN